MVRRSDWRCRAGSRYLYICENGLVHYCSQQRGFPATPLAEYTRDDVKRYFGSTFAIDERRLNAMMSIVDSAQVRRRFFIHPVDYIIESLLGDQWSSFCWGAAGILAIRALVCDTSASRALRPRQPGR